MIPVRSPSKETKTHPVLANGGLGLTRSDLAVGGPDHSSEDEESSQAGWRAVEPIHSMEIGI